jgi:hypothetical protein
MAKPTKNSKANKNSAVPVSVVDLAHERKQLLAQMAVQIAPSVMEDPGPGVDSPEAIAQVCVDIAEAILQKAGL